MPKYQVEHVLDKQYLAITYQYYLMPHSTQTINIIIVNKYVNVMYLVTFKYV